MKKGFYYQTSLGKVGIAQKGEAIVALSFGELVACHIEETDLLSKAAAQLSEYLKGRRKVFQLPLAPEGTAFQRKVWNALRTIPYGQTKSYGQIAEKIGNKNAARAVGLANRENPILILIPCHRVIGSAGELGGYSGGMELKKKLLALEKANFYKF